MWRYRELISDLDEGQIVSLGEGATPLVSSSVVGESLGINRLFFKLESSNPTGSYKDRFASAAVSHMLKRGQRRCLATSSGNTGSALAAYCARAGIPLEITLVDGTPPGKLMQMAAHGAELVMVAGFGLDPQVSAKCFAHLETRCQKEGAALQVSAFRFSPDGMDGVVSLGLEMAAALPQVRHVFMPAGGGGLALAVIRGFLKASDQGMTSAVPAVHVVQPDGCATIAGPLARGLESAVEVNCSSRISGLQVGNVIDGDETLRAAKQVGGNGFLPSDAQIYAAQKRLAHQEGIFCEPAGATALAGLALAAEQQMIKRHEPTICVVTGIGFKDPDSAENLANHGEVKRVELDEFLSH